MATWLEFPFECSPRELEVVGIVFDYKTLLFQSRVVERSYSCIGPQVQVPR